MMKNMTQALAKIITHSTRYRHDPAVKTVTCQCNYADNYYNDQVCINTPQASSR